MISIDDNPLYALSMDAFDFCLDLAEPKIALDIGANDGGYTNTLLQHGYEVYAYEPVPDVFNQLFARYADNPKVHCSQVAVSDTAGRLENVTVLCSWTLGRPNEIDLAQSPQYTSRRVSGGHSTDSCDSGYFNVDTIKLDDQIYPQGIGFIKLDVDGYEMHVLRGAEALLNKWGPPILCEFSVYIEKLGTPSDKFVEWIFNHGYHIFSMDGKRRFMTISSVVDFYPRHGRKQNTSFDVMLVPCRMSDHVCRKFNP